MDIGGVRVTQAISASSETCATCANSATMVINGKAQCDRCAGMHILAEHPEIIGALVGDRLRQA